MKKIIFITRVLLATTILIVVFLVFNSNINIEVNKPKEAAGENKTVPIAIAGLVDTRVTIYGGGHAILDGSGSFDPDGGDIVSYKWVIVDSPHEYLLGKIIYVGSEAKAPDQKYRAEDIGAWVYELEITDDEGSTDRATKTVFVQATVDAILKTKKILASQVDFLVASDIVLGLELNGEAVAYPAQVVYPHAIVNDVVGGEPIYVVFCEACQSGTVKLRQVGKQVLTFKSAGGSLEEENFLSYDLETKSTWHIVYGEAQEGPLAGTVLEELEIELKTWGEWLEKYPESLVLVGEL